MLFGVEDSGLTSIEWCPDASHRHFHELLPAHPLLQDLAEVGRYAMAPTRGLVVALLEDPHAVARIAQHVSDCEPSDA